MSLRLRRVTPLLLLVPGISAQLATEVTNTTGDGMVGWVSPVARRSTWDIIWGCLSIFIVCSWKCVHLNTPSYEESRGEWHHLGSVPIWPTRPLWRKWFRKIMWMMVIAIAPEIGVGLSVHQFLEARRDLQAMGHREYSMAHAFYVQMGGIVICELDLKTDQEALNIARSATTSPDNLVLGGDVLTSSNQNIALENLYTSRPTSKMGLKNGYIINSLKSLDDAGTLFTLSEDDIKDMSKTDVFTKLFALVQCGWLIVQSIARRAEGHVISQLELATMAFILCALVMHLFWWHKPFGVEKRHVIVRLPSGMSRISGRLDVTMDTLVDVVPEVRKTRVRDSDLDTCIDLLLSEDGLFMLDSRIKGSTPFFATYATGISFSAIHLAAWNWEFPTPAVQTCWRAFALGAVVISVTPIVVSLVLDVLEKSYKIASENSLTAIFGIIFVLYVVSRLSVLVLTFYCLSSMPASVYMRADWTGWIPHFS